MLTAAHELVKDDFDSLNEFAYDLEQIINHCRYLITQCEARQDELEDGGDRDDEEEEE